MNSKYKSVWKLNEIGAEQASDQLKSLTLKPECADRRSIYRQPEGNRASTFLHESQLRSALSINHPDGTSISADELLSIIGPTDEDFSGFKVTMQHVKGNLNSCKNVASYLEKQGEIHAEYSKAIKKCAQSTVNAYNAANTKQGSFAVNWKGVLEGTAKNAEECGYFSKKLLVYATTLSQDIKRFEKDAKKMQALAESSIKAYKESSKTLSKAKARRETSVIELQNHIYQNKPVNPSAASAKTLKTYEKVLGERNKRAEQCELAYKETKQQFDSLRSELFQKTIPSITKGLIEIDTELSEATNRILHSYATDMQILSHEYDKETKSTKGRINRIEDSKDFENYLSKFFYYSRAEKSAECIKLGLPLADCVEKRETAAGTVELFAPAYLLTSLKYLQKAAKSVANFYEREIKLVPNYESRLANCFGSVSEENVLIVAHFVKEFFAKLPEPLLDYQFFVQLTLHDDVDRELVLERMPMEAFVVFKALFDHFQLLIGNGDYSAAKLASVFAPLLFGNRHDAASCVAIMENLLN